MSETNFEESMRKFPSELTSMRGVQFNEKCKSLGLTWDQGVTSLINNEMREDRRDIPMATPLRYEVWINQKYAVFCLYNYGGLGISDPEMCKFKDGANTLKDAKKQMKAHYAEMHGKDRE